MRKGAPDSKENEKKREKTSDKMSGTRSVAHFHDHPAGIRGNNAPSVISERSDSDIPGIYLIDSKYRSCYSYSK